MDEHSRRSVLKTSALAIIGLGGCSTLTSEEGQPQFRDQRSTEASSAASNTRTTCGSTASTTDKATRIQTQRIDELEERIESLRDRLAEKNDRLSTLEEQLEERQDELDELETTLQQREARIESLESQLTEERDRLETLRDRIQNRDERIETLKDELNQREDRIAELESQITTVPEDIREEARETGTDVRESVVRLRGELNRGYRGGTGWFIEDDLIISNGHVVRGIGEFTCYLPNGDSFEATVIDSRHGSYGSLGHIDVAVLRTENSGTPLERGDSTSLAEGQPLVQVGHPSYVGNWIISLGEFVGDDDFYGFRSTVPTMAGNSGSPVTTLDGKVVGLTGGSTDDDPSETSRRNPTDTVFTSYEGETHATHNPIEAVSDFVDDVI